MKSTTIFLLSLFPWLAFAQNAVVESVPGPTGFMSRFDLGREKYRFLIVEKPGVKYLQTEGSESFDRKFSLESWAGAIVEALNHTVRNEKIDENRILQERTWSCC